MTKQDKELIHRLQTDFPLTSQPFASIAKDFDLTEEEVLNKVEEWQKSGLIRYMGPSFSVAKLGFSSTLCAAEVPDEKLNEFVAIINQLPGVTHNYRRNHKKNIWFTLIEPNKNSLLETIGKIKKQTGITILNLPAQKMFKLKVELELN